MNETANIKQIITAFHNIISIYENHQWVKTVTSEDIKIAFKLGCFVEKSMCKFMEQNCGKKFLETLNMWGDLKKTLNYEQNFYLKMCDHLLLNFFKHKTLNENILDVAVRMYTSLFPKERLQHVLKELIMTSASYDAIFDFVVANKPVIDTNNLKHQLILQDWCEDYECGNKDKIVALITDSLSSFKAESCVLTLLSILAMNVHNPVTKLILDNLLEKMLDRSILSKSFWLALLRNVDHSCLCEVSCHHPQFLESLCSFLIYIGGMMEEVKSDDKVQWISNSNISLCPEISYNELEAIFVSLCQSESVIVKECVINRLNNAQEYMNLSIWDHIIHKCL